MSRTVDSRVVEMSFDNRNFESNVSTSISTLDKLKAALNMDSAANSLQKVSEASNNVKLDGLSGAVETVHAKFSALEVMAVTALANIANSAVNAGKNLVESFTIAPIKQGFDEYEQKMTAVQTIMASTGEDLAAVTDQLNELNAYADNTSYSFSDMTSNIGKFTNAGVGLEPAVDAMKGISNAAALAGANSNEAGRAMYNFAQALSAGYVKLIDWKSIENANMATVDFKQSLIDTAVAMGTLTKEGDKYVSTTTDIRGNTSAAFNATSMFNESLNHQWMTTDVLTQTLNNYAVEVDKMTDDQKKAFKEQLIAMNYTAEQADRIMEQASKANKAAQDFKTFSEVVGAIQESVGSGWAQTFEHIFGNIEEAKVLWGGVYDAIEPIFTSSINARNEMLKAWKVMDVGGRADAIDAIVNAWNALKQVVLLVREAFREVFPRMTAENLASGVKAIKDFTENLGMGDKVAGDFKATFKGLFSAIKIVITAIKAVAAVTIGPLSKAFVSILKEILDLTGSMGRWVTALSEGLKSNDKFGASIKFVEDAVAWLCEKLKGLRGILHEVFEYLKTTDWGEFFTNVINKITAAYEKIKNFLSNAFDYLFENVQFEDVLRVFEDGLIVYLILILKKIATAIKDAFKSAGDVMSSVTGVLDSLKDCLVAYQQQIQARKLLLIATAIVLLVAAIKVLMEIEGDKILDAVQKMMLVIGTLGAAMGLLTLLKGDAVGAAGTLVMLAAALNLMVGPIERFAEIDTKTLAMTMGILVVFIAELAAFVEKTGKIDKASFKGMAGLLALSHAVRGLVRSVEILAGINWKSLLKGMVAVQVLLKGLFGFLVGTSVLKADMLIETAVALDLLAVSIMIFAQAIEFLGTMKLTDMIQGLAGLAVVLAALIATMKLMPKEGMFLQLSVELVAFAVAGLLLAEAIKSLGELEWDQMAVGLLALGAAILTLGVAVKLLDGVEYSAAGLAMLAASMLALAAGLRILSQLSPGEVATALITLAGALTILGVAARVLKPYIYVLGELARVCLLFGAAAAACGVGILALSVGLTGLAASGVAGMGTFVLQLRMLLSLIPFAIQQFGLGIMALIQLWADNRVALVEAGMQIFNAFLEGMAEEIPHVIDVVMTFIGDLILAISDNIALWAEQGVLIIASLIAGMGQGLTEHKEEIKEALIEFFKGLIDLALELLGIHSPSTVFADMGVNIVLGLIKGIGDKAKEFLTKIGDLIKNAIKAVKDKVKDFFNKGKELIENLKEGAGAKLEAVKTKAKDIALGAVGAIGKKAGEFKTKGQELIEKVRSGFGQKKTELVNKAKSIIDSAKEGIRNKRSQLLSAGAHILGGLTEGIRNKARAVVDAAVNAAKNAVSAVKRWLGISSPSKVFAWIGQMSDEGWAGGMKRYAGSIYDTASTIGRNTVDGVAKAVDGISEVINDNIDAEPVIRPVMDLTDISKGVDSMNGMLSSQKTIDVAGNASVAINKAADTALNKEHSFMSELKAVVSKPDDGGATMNITNTFNITGDNPREIADEVSRILQQQVERREASWA